MHRFAHMSPPSQSDEPSDPHDPRLEAYREAALAMESGRFNVEVPGVGADEVGALGEALVRLGHALERKYKELKALLEVGERASEGLLVDEVCEHVYDAFRDLIPYHRMGLALISDDFTRVSAYWARNDGAVLQITPGFDAPLAGSSLNRILETGRCRILNDLPGYLEDHPNSESTRLIVAEGIRSSLTCPLISQGKPVGFLFFSSRSLRAYEDAHVQLFQQIAGHLSGVIEKSRLYGQLLELSELKNGLLGMAAHDMRSPLTVILGWVDMLRAGFVGDLPDEADGLLRHIEASALQVLRLVEDLLDVSVIEAGRLELNRESVDLVRHLEQQAESAGLLARAKGVTLELDLPEGVACASVDPVRLTQIVDNLLSNAVKFSPPQSTVRLCLRRSSEGWVLSVIDEGPGIPPEELDGLFAVFERTSVRPTAGERSIGLGLAITRRMVEAHGGRVTASSELCRGSVFTVELPVQAG